MNQPLVGREEIVRALQTALEPLPYVHAMWQGGAAAFQRVDQWSDIDLQIDADDERTAEVFAVIETTLAQISPIAVRFEIPQPTWHGHGQIFYRLRDTSPFLLIDVVVLKHSNPNKFLQPEIHGQTLVHFDKIGVVQAPVFDQAGWLSKLKNRVASMQSSFELFQTLTLKELRRGNNIEAISFYMAFTLRPLVELLRIIHQPARFDFNTRYVYYDLPAAVIERLELLFFITNPADLATKRETAAAWFAETLAQLDWQAVAQRLAPGPHQPSAEH